MIVADVVVEGTRLFGKSVAVREGDQASDKFFRVPGTGLSFADLWSTKAKRQFERAFGNGELARHLDRRLFNRRENLVLRIPEGAASMMPWEGFQGYLDSSNRKRFVPLRMLNRDEPWSLGFPAEKMSLIALIGHPGSQPDFQPDEVRSHLTSVYKSLDAASLERMTPVDSFPVVVLPDQSLEAAAEIVSKVRPNVVLYFGHGQYKSQPELLTGPTGTDWIPLSSMIDRLFAHQTDRPIYWIFWACSLADDSAGPKMDVEGPEILTILEQRGGVSVLAMRSRIRVAFSEIMLRALIQALAAGEPLECAAALARTAACNSGLDNNDGRIDFAAPAVWSVSQPVEHVDWGSPDTTFPLAWVSLPLLSIDSGYEELETGVASVAVSALAHAREWAPCRNVFVRLGNGPLHENLEGKSHFFNVASAIRERFGRPVVPILLPSGLDFDQRLRRWAGKARLRLDPRHDSRSLAVALEIMERSGLVGLEQLLTVPKVCVMLSTPPDSEDIWTLLSAKLEGTTVIVVGSTVPALAKHWILDQFGEANTKDNRTVDSFVQRVVATTPVAAAMLALLRRPVSLTKVAEFSGEDRTSVAAADALTVPVGSKRVMAETVRREITGKLSKATIRTAHERCLRLLTTPQMEGSMGALLEVAEHLAKLTEWDRCAKLVNLEYLHIGAEWTLSDLRDLAEFAGSSNDLLSRLSDELVLDLARACVQVQDTSFARSILEHRTPVAPRAQALWHAILHEAYKADVESSASKRSMRLHANAAVTIAKQALTQDPQNLDLKADLAAFRLNVARIAQYFEHDTDSAFKIYSELITELSEQEPKSAGLAQILAAAGRNGAECLFDFGASPLSKGRREQAEDMLAQALAVAQRHGLKEIAAELQYSTARLFETVPDLIEAQSILAEVVRATRKEHFPLLEAIASDRAYWLSVRGGDRAFRLDEAQSRLTALEKLDWHAWALRVSMKNRLRISRHLAVTGRATDRDVALKLLERNKELSKIKRGLGGWADKLRIARTYAGLELLTASDAPRPWQDFLQFDWARDLIEETNLRTPSDVWERIS